MSDSRTLLSHAAQQCELGEKYAKILKQGELMHTLKKESQVKWQFPKFYLCAARPLDNQADREYCEKIQNADPTFQTFKVDKSWEEMKKIHAWECQNYIMQHQKAMQEIIKAKTESKVLRQ